MNLYKILSKVIKIADSAGNKMLDLQDDVRRIEKEKKDFLTSADLISHNYILSHLEKIYPGMPVYSEESEEKLMDTCWVIDPADGTINYFNKDKYWGISIALVENRETRLGVVVLPAMGISIGVEGSRKIVKNTRLFLNQTDKMSEANIWTDWSKQVRDIPLILSKLQSASMYPQIRLCSTASLLAVATGITPAYIHPGPAPEDFAAGAYIVEAAGGKVTDMSGDPWNINSQSIIASNNRFHSQIVELFK